MVLYFRLVDTLAANYLSS